MAEKRKISVRKILQLVVTLVVTICCITAMVSASKIEDQKTVKKISVHIKNDKKYHFIEQQEILDIAVKRQNIDLEHTPISKLDVNGMEREIMADPWVANAQVYIDNECTLQMYVTQRIPIARVFDRSNRTYYLDTTMSIMPISPNYIYYTTVITNMPDINNDSLGWSIRKDVITMVRRLQRDSFWSAQISQIVVDSAGMYELVPVLGDHRIVFGDVSRMKEKFDNLFIFYKNVLNRIGWDKYEMLDLRFRGQVVASPSLPYKGPTDRAVVNMNWINSIVETEARNDARNELKDSLKTGGVKTESAKPTATDGKGKDAKGKPVLLNGAKKGSDSKGDKGKPKKDDKKGDKKVDKKVDAKGKAPEKKVDKPAAKPAAAKIEKKTTDNSKQATDKKTQQDKKDH